MNAAEERGLDPVRCRTCGTTLGYRKQNQTTEIMTWCSSACFDITLSPTNEIRDEIVTDLYLSKTLPFNDIAETVGVTPQRLRQIIDRRQLLPDQQHHDRRLAKAEYMRNWRRERQENRS